MSGYGASLPLKMDASDGPFTLLQDLKAIIFQNLKMIVLTSPGERIMDPNFGVGLKNYLFEPDTRRTHNTIKSKIINQVGEYMPFLEIEEVTFQSQATGHSFVQSNALQIEVKFFIVPLSVSESLEISI